jgi:hypothetical protein
MLGDFYNRFKDNVPREILEEMVQWFIDKMSQDDEWLCNDCLRNLGRDMPEARMCQICEKFYCDEDGDQACFSKRQECCGKRLDE